MKKYLWILFVFINFFLAGYFLSKPIFLWVGGRKGYVTPFDIALVPFLVSIVVVPLFFFSFRLLQKFLSPISETRSRIFLTISVIFFLGLNLFLGFINPRILCWYGSEKQEQCYAKKAMTSGKNPFEFNQCLKAKDKNSCLLDISFYSFISTEGLNWHTQLFQEVSKKMVDTPETIPSFCNQITGEGAQTVCAENLIAHPVFCHQPPGWNVETVCVNDSLIYQKQMPSFPSATKDRIQNICAQFSLELAKNYCYYATGSCDLATSKPLSDATDGFRILRDFSANNYRDGCFEKNQKSEKELNEMRLSVSNTIQLLQFYLAKNSKKDQTLNTIFSEELETIKNYQEKNDLNNAYSESLNVTQYADGSIGIRKGIHEYRGRP